MRVWAHRVKSIWVDDQMNVNKIQYRERTLNNETQVRMTTSEIVK